MKESILPRMHTNTQDIVLGGIIKHVQDKKMVIVLGEPGEGKTITVLDFCMQNTSPSYYYRCSPNTTMNSLLIFIANAIGIRVVGSNDELQNRIQKKLQQNPDYCFVFDEAEYLAYGNGTKIDVLRQIFDETDVPIILCGTYVLKDLISGERKKNADRTHNRPQIFRRLRKEEFEMIEEKEVLDYLAFLETNYAVIFDTRVKQDLISICRDRQSGGLGNFIEIIELIFSLVRPEWKDISNQLNILNNRTVHTHDETAQSFTAIKPDKDDNNISTNRTVIHEETQNIVDVSSLTTVTIDISLLKDALRHKMTM